jgi:hypothetical protein
MIECACVKRDKQLQEYEDKLKELNLDIGGAKSFKGCKSWIKELNEVEKVIEEGISLGWSYGKDIAKFR